MNRLVKVGAALLLVMVVLAVVLTVVKHEEASHTVSTYILCLFPTGAVNVSIVGSYLSDSRYSMGIIYGPQASLYVSPFLWNVRQAGGAVNMTLTPYLVVNVDLTHVVKINPSIPVDGYPSLMYGQEYWFPFAGRTLVSPLLPLPGLVADLPNFTSVIKYQVYCSQGIIQDFSYDIWLTTNPNTTYLQYGDFEVMIWMYWNENLTSNHYFVYVGNMAIPTLINGTYKDLEWEVYILPRTGSPSGWTGIYILSPLRHEEGVIGVPIKTILMNIKPYLEKAGIDNYDPSKYYLDAIQVGMEFNDNQGNADLGYTLYYWCIALSTNQAQNLTKQ